MNIEILDVNNEKKMSAFLKVKNEAFKARSSERMPFVYRTEKDLKEKLSIGESFVAIANVDNQVVGGMGCRYLIEDGLKVAELFWIATSDKYQRRGVAKNLFYYVEDKAYSNNVHFVRLNVLKAATPAISLYKKMGYKPYKVWAYTEGTSCYIQYIKPMETIKGWAIKRILTLVISKLKYWILFKDDNSPTWIYRLVYHARRGKHEL